MKKAIPYWQVVGFLFTAVMGTFLHFLFNLTGGSLVAALVSAVNESIWEHLKLLFYPMLLFALAEHHFWGRDMEEFWCVKLIGLLVGLSLIPIVYYTYTGILGVKADWFNITIFFLVAGVVYWVETKLFQGGCRCPICPKTAFVLICLLAVTFTILTFVPPRIPFFQDPITGTYGYYGKRTRVGE